VGSLDIAIIGFGRLAELCYTPALRSLNGIRVTGIADPREAALERASRVFPSARLASSAEEMLRELQLDALLVASSPSTHWRIWQLAVTRALPVFMEKPFPMTENLAELEQLSESRLPLMIDFNRRFWPLYRDLASRCTDGSIGDPLSARFQLHVNIRRWSSVTDHRLNEAEGGALHDLGAQTVDLALETFKRNVESVTASRESGEGQRFVIHMRMDGELDVTCDVAYAARTREQVEVNGSRGRLRILEPNMALRQDPYASPIQSFGALARDGMALAGRVLNPDRSLLRYSIRMALKHFFETLRCGGNFVPGIKEALRTARILATVEQPPARGKAHH